MVRSIDWLEWSFLPSPFVISIWANSNWNAYSICSPVDCLAVTIAPTLAYAQTLDHLKTLVMVVASVRSRWRRTRSFLISWAALVSLSVRRTLTKFNLFVKHLFVTFRTRWLIASRPLLSFACRLCHFGKLVACSFKEAPFLASASTFVRRWAISLFGA